MALFNFKPQSFFSSLFIKPLNSFISYFSSIFKPKQIPLKEDVRQYKGNTEMKTISTFPLEPKNPTALETCAYLRREVADLHRRLDFFKSEQDLILKKKAHERAALAPREERSFVTRLFSR